MALSLKCTQLKNTNINNQNKANINHENKSGQGRFKQQQQTASFFSKST
jgi:hypothetical protein